jgi:hypothetical protein
MRHHPDRRRAGRTGRGCEIIILSASQALEQSDSVLSAARSTCTRAGHGFLAQSHGSGCFYLFPSMICFFVDWSWILILSKLKIEEKIRAMDEELNFAYRSND